MLHELPDHTSAAPASPRKLRFQASGAEKRRTLIVPKSR
jgi:hypothetical protein